MNPVWAIGLMTGTVLDGNIDIAMIESDGTAVTQFGAYTLSPYPDGLLELLTDAMEAARTWQFNGPEPAIFAKAERELTRAQSVAVANFLHDHKIPRGQIGVIGFHGQTVLHRPAAQGMAGATRQLGDGPLMANLLGIPVVYDLRSADVAAGGQGAPLAPVYHKALIGQLAGRYDPKDVVLLNLGGVGNLTWWDGSDTLMAFDTGPANAPINDWVKQHGNNFFDKDGQLAAKGTVDEARLAAALANPWFDQKPPKSLDRFSFTKDLASGLSLEDGAALLTAFSASAVAKAVAHLPHRPKVLAVCGGGRKNPTFMRELFKRTQIDAKPVEAFGWRGDAIEAECFAFLAIRSALGLPLSFSQTTGVSRPCTGGELYVPTIL
ncbi:anhydro-N-acetylmuramic acid kinase [Pseudovibrio sp. SPO723]|uniref:anhydro-N-acetylmuramic acid kinase n=1 Tax=Nesiotobacter zosterae TaxID=392721 RepID=UPI0029C12ED7|nr:anhydro-N-acetylmuramic acid kinase [Pseudovibrio sp. SPO723]MDX5594595.1 anhydro-N-acetylmuramic acid kinase [Pseudovibrio sp. SPO723]